MLQGLGPRIIALTAVLAVVPPAAFAQTSDPRATDAAKMFAAMCISPSGARQRAEARLGMGSGFAKRLSPAEVQVLQDGREGGAGWALTSPGKAEFTLDFATDGVCSVRLKAVGSNAAQAAFDEAVRAYAARIEAPVTASASAGPDRILTFPMAGRSARASLTGGAEAIMNFELTGETAAE